MSKTKAETGDATRRRGASAGSAVSCRCWDAPGTICINRATHVVGERGKRSFPLPCCPKHAEPYKQREDKYAVLSLPNNALAKPHEIEPQKKA